MKAFAPWVSIRFIHDPVGDSGFFMSMGRKCLARQLCCHAVCSLSFPTRPIPFPAVMPPAYLAPNITTLPSCQVLRWQASRQPHPPPAPTVRRRPMRSCCASPHRACRARTLPPPGGSLLFRCVPEPSQPLASRQDCHGPGILFFFFVHSGYQATSLCSDAPKPGSLPIASGASQTTAARRLLCPCGLSNLFLRPGRLRFAQTALAGCYRSGRRDPYRATLETGHVSALLPLVVLRDTADTSCAVTAASLRSSFILSPPPAGLASLGRPEAGLF